MLRNDQTPVEDLLLLLNEAAGSLHRPIGQVAAPAVADRDMFAGIRAQWALAIVAPHGNSVLRRYFTYHLDLLNKFYELIAVESAGDHFLNEADALTDHLFVFFGKFLDRKARVPVRYTRLRVLRLRRDAEFLIQYLNHAGGKWTCCIVPFLSSLFLNDAGLQLSVAELFFSEKVLHELIALMAGAKCGCTADQLRDKLIRLNFNAIDFLLLLQDEVRAALAGLSLIDQVNALRIRLAALPSGLTPHLGLDSEVPHLSVMMRQWLIEEISFLQEKVTANAGNISVIIKLGLNLSVAQLACLIRLFFEEGHYSTQNLSEIFRLTATYLSTKRQTDISWESLAKEYYIISQATAGAIKSMLQQMVVRLNHTYFPVWVVTGATILFAAEIC